MQYFWKQLLFFARYDKLKIFQVLSKCWRTNAADLEVLSSGSNVCQCSEYFSSERYPSSASSSLFTGFVAGANDRAPGTACCIPCTHFVLKLYDATFFFRHKRRRVLPRRSVLCLTMLRGLVVNEEWEIRWSCGYKQHFFTAQKTDESYALLRHIVIVFISYDTVTFPVSFSFVYLWKP